MRLEGCLPGTETVVFAHLNKDSGMGMKNKVGKGYQQWIGAAQCAIIAILPLMDQYSITTIKNG